MTIPDGHNLYKPNPGLAPNKDDNHVLEWGREVNTGFMIGRSSSPSFFTADGHNVKLEDSARGCSVMIMFNDADTKVSYNGVHTWCVNEAINHCKPDLWTVFNNPQAYNLSLWNSPRIIKILPIGMSYMRLKNSRLVSHNPYSFYFRRHSSFNAASFYSEETVWSDGSKESEIISMIKLSTLMGYRHIYLNGIKIDKNTNVFKNLTLLQGFTDKNNVKIYNCTTDNNDIFTPIAPDEACKRCILS